MFGKNQLLKQEERFDGTYWVQEIFDTIQGEGPFAGLPAIFIRLAGCNLRCHFCDTDFESSNDHLSLEQIGARLQAIEKQSRPRLFPLVVITGGEPLRQRIGFLVNMLVKMEFHVQIETAGTVWDDTLEDHHLVYKAHGIAEYDADGSVTVTDEQWMRDPRLTFVCSPKTGRINPMVAMVCQHYKYIVNADPANMSLADGLPLLSTQERTLLQPVWRCNSNRDWTWVQPETAYYPDNKSVNPVQTQRNIEHAARVCMQYGYRLSLQQHRIVGLP